MDWSSWSDCNEGSTYRSFKGKNSFHPEISSMMLMLVPKGPSQVFFKRNCQKLPFFSALPKIRKKNFFLNFNHTKVQQTIIMNKSKNS